MNFSFLAKISIGLALSIHATHACNLNTSPINVVSATSSNAADLDAAFEAFRTLLGGESNGSDPKSNPTGHRQINWDGGAPFDMPGNFFATPVTRGLIVATTNGDDEFILSDPPASQGIADNKFSSIVNNKQAAKFIAKSEPRLFSPLNDNEIIVSFVDPGDIYMPALVTGFGAVFCDVELDKVTKMEFYDYNGCLLAEQYVPVEEGGLSFVGVDFGDASIVAQVKITLGTHAIGKAYRRSVRGRGRGKGKGKGKNDDDKKDDDGELDIVVMDDFLYGEPQPVSV